MLIKYTFFETFPEVVFNDFDNEQLKQVDEICDILNIST